MPEVNGLSAHLDDDKDDEIKATISLEGLLASES